MKRIGSIVLSLLILPAAASADSFSATFAGIGMGAGVSGSIGTAAFNNVFAGQIKWDATGFDDFISYCVQFDTSLLPTQQFETSTPSQISAQDAAQISYLVTKNFASVTTNWMAAGLQLAIWNVLYDTDFLASSGTFASSTSSATRFANLFLSDLAGKTNPTGNALFLNSVPGTVGQDQVTVPEAGTLLLLGIGAATLAARRRAQRKKTN